MRCGFLLWETLSCVYDVFVVINYYHRHHYRLSILGFGRPIDRPHGASASSATSSLTACRRVSQYQQETRRHRRKMIAGNVSSSFGHLIIPLLKVMVSERQSLANYYDLCFLFLFHFLGRDSTRPYEGILLEWPITESSSWLSGHAGGYRGHCRRRRCQRTARSSTAQIQKLGWTPSISYRFTRWVSRIWKRGFQSAFITSVEKGRVVSNRVGNANTVLTLFNTYQHGQN